MALFNKIIRLRQVYFLRTYTTQLPKNEYFNRKHDPFNDIFTTKFAHILKEPNNVSKETWESMRKYVTELCTDQRDVDHLILKMFFKKSCLDGGINYYKFLKNNNYDISLNVRSGFLVLYEAKEKFTESDKIDILDTCNEIKNQCKFLPLHIAEIIGKSLCKLNKWEEAIEVIKEFETHDSQFLSGLYVCLIVYLFDNNKADLGMKYFSYVLQNKKLSSPKILEAYLNYCLQGQIKGHFNERIEEMFLVWRRYGVKPSLKILNEYIEACNNAGWTAELTKISNFCCEACKHELVDEPLCEEEFTKLNEAVLNALTSMNVYQISSPIEVQAFIKFMNEHKPYDIVIDGLNSIFYIRSSDFKKLITNLSNAGNKVLIIGRDHLKKHLRSLLTINNVDIFFVANDSNDDKFVICAALLSGNGTKLVTKDLMRQHKVNFDDDEIQFIFKRWQVLHQYTVCVKKLDIKRMDLKSCVEPFAQKQKNCWHIPYYNVEIVSVLKNHKGDANWACFKKPDKNGTLQMLQKSVL